MADLAVLSECPDFTPDGFQQLFKMVQSLQLQLQRQLQQYPQAIIKPKGKEKSKRPPVGLADQTCQCSALVWNNGDGARCSKKSAIGEYCTAHYNAINTGKHKHGTIAEPCARFRDKDFSKEHKAEEKPKKIPDPDKLSKSKPKSKDKDQAKAKTQPTLTRTTIEQCLKSLTKEFQYSDEVDSITTVKVMESLGLTSLSQAQKSLLEKVTHEYKISLQKSLPNAGAGEGVKSDSDGDDEEAEEDEDEEEEDDGDEEEGEECECDEIEIEGQVYLIETKTNNVYTNNEEDPQYLGRYSKGMIDTSLPEQ